MTTRTLKVVVFLCLLVASYLYASGDRPHLDVRPPPPTSTPTRTTVPGATDSSVTAR